MLPVPVPHEGLEAARSASAAIRASRFPFPMRGWKNRIISLHPPVSAGFPFPMRGWKSVHGKSRCRLYAFPFPMRGWKDGVGERRRSLWSSSRSP